MVFLMGAKNLIVVLRINKFNGYFGGREKFNRRFAHVKNLMVILMGTK